MENYPKRKHSGLVEISENSLTENHLGIVFNLIIYKNLKT